MKNNDILKCLGLDHTNVQSLDVYNDHSSLIIEIILNSYEHICPICSTPTSKIKGYQLKTINHSIFNQTPCIIKYNARIYQCPVCKKTFYEDNPFAYKGSRISYATVCNVLEDLKNPSSTFTLVAKRHHLSPSSVSLIFDKHINIPRKSLGECISFDETYAFKSKDSHFICVLLDYTSKNIIDILPSRKKQYLSDYFFKIPLEERKKVKFVSFDMWETYRIISKLYFPNALLIVDKFHVLQELSRRVTKVRIDVMKKNKKLYDELHNEMLIMKQKKQNMKEDKIEKLRQADINYYLLKKFEWLLFTNKVLDPNDEKKMNHKLGQYLNYCDIYDMILNIDKDLEEAVDLKEMMSQFYKKETHQTAKKELEEIIVLFRSSSIKEMSGFADTLSRWKNEIINSFIIIPSINKKMNNALIENRNKSIKLIKHSSNGYLNWNRFRSRVLYCLNDNEQYIIKSN